MGIRWTHSSRDAFPCQPIDLLTQEGPSREDYLVGGGGDGAAAAGSRIWIGGILPNRSRQIAVTQSSC
jgi:hypothetical protein